MNIQSLIFFPLIIIFYIIAFGGIHLGWSNIIYDEWRIITLILLFMLALVPLHKVFFIKYDKKLLQSSSYNFIFFFTLLSCIIVAVNYKSYTYLYFSLVDFSLYALLMLGCMGLYEIYVDLIENDESKLIKIYLLISILPFLTIICFLSSLFLFWSSGYFFDWKVQFSNKRMYDSVILVFIFFILNFRKYINNKSFEYFYLFLLGLYILSLFFDNARSALISLIVGLFFIFLLYKNERYIIFTPIFLIVSSGVIYLFFQIFSLTGDVVRVTTSGRSELWLYAYEKWISSPILGIGGASFGLDQTDFISRSAHNLIIQMIGEWGILGFSYLCIIGTFVATAFKYKNNIPPFLMAGLIAILVDSMFSAVLVYPLLMFVCANLFALTLAYCPRTHRDKLSKNFNLSQKIFYIVIFVFSVSTIIIIHGQDFLCIGCTSIDEFHGPRFWEYGRSLNLQPVEQKMD